MQSRAESIVGVFKNQPEHTVQMLVIVGIWGALSYTATRASGRAAAESNVLRYLHMQYLERKVL